jgi:hypothetical protein
VVASIATAGGKASAHARDGAFAGAAQEVAERVGDVYGLVNNAPGTSSPYRKT